jgi:hypothetical protein
MEPWWASDRTFTWLMCGICFNIAIIYISTAIRYISWFKTGIWQ